MATLVPPMTHDHLALDECPNCGAPTHTQDRACPFCDAELVRPSPPPPPAATPTTSSGFSWTSPGAIILVVWGVFFVGTLLFVGFVMVVGVIVGPTTTTTWHNTYDASSPWTTPTTSRPLVTTSTLPQPPDIQAPIIHGSGDTRTLDCTAGQSYILDGDGQTINASGRCGTVIVQGNALQVHLDGADDLWVTGNGITVTVTEVGTITSIGNGNRTTWTRGTDGADPTIVKTAGWVEKR